MPISPRLLRAQTDGLPGARHAPTPKETEQRTRILEAATVCLATHGASSFTLGNFAAAIRMASATIRRHFTDLDAILGEILRLHLHAIAEAIGEPPPRNHPNPKAVRRAAYITATRRAANAHALLLRQRHTLPPDVLGPLDELRLHIGTLIAGEHAETALALMDTPSLSAEQVERMLATLDGTDAGLTSQEGRSASPSLQRPLGAPVSPPGEMVDAADLKSAAFGRTGSSPVAGTTLKTIGFLLINCSQVF